ncbi:MAG TPA: hypothetical protein VGQ28_14750, partial [Thermoanaerobaculia bacterium]|nr:hypothetical protein [Thermoanaerobaculia bacterium]
MAETAFAAEVDLQKLLARHPGLLPGDQIDPESPRRWLLVAREVSVPDDAGTRWALDHLFLDQEGVPTLVEVKRGSDPRTRREVVGQLLDYAAHSVLYWTEETIRTRFEERSRQEQNDPDAELLQFLGDGIAANDFWQRVKTNLQAGKIRLIFVSDAIPSELRRVVEFLNQQMDPAEVLAVEIRQYAGGSLKTLVPRVMGQTSEALIRKTGGGRPTREWNEASFFAELTSRRGEAAAEVARRILGWSLQKGCRIWWGKGVQSGSFLPMVDHAEDEYWTIAVWTYGTVEILFKWMLKKRPFDTESKRRELRAKLNAIPDVSIPEDGIE